jgi:pimeloyl-ACP methyl ester carboxylesterase
VLQFLKYGLFLLLILAVVLAVYIYANQAPDRSVEELSKRWAQAPSTFVNVAGMNIHLRDEGPKTDPEPIVLIHGTSASLHTWDGWADALSQKRRVIRFDLPGFGLTGPDPKSNYTIEHYAYIVDALLKQLKVEKVVLGGNSLGGYVAWATAIFYPDRVTKLILVDASGYQFESESVPLAFKLSQYPIVSLLLQDVLPKSVVENSIKNVYGNPDLVSAELIQRYYELSLREGNRAALKERFKQLSPGALVDKLSTISVPTLIMWGGKDRLIPPKLGAQFQADIANSQLLVFDSLGHVPHEEDPKTTVLAVKEFLNENRANQ